MSEICFEMCFLCHKEIKKKSIPIPFIESHPNLKELVIRMDHDECRSIFDSQKKLSADIKRWENNLLRDKQKLLNLEWEMYKLGEMI